MTAIAAERAPLTVVAAVLLPPLGVFLSRGLGTWFWIDVVLTVLGWVPGALFALLVLFKPKLLTRA